MSIAESSVVGALLGCAVGDALGAPFEGLWSNTIPSTDALIAGFHEFHGFPRGQYTDDTQLTIATIESIVECQGVNLADMARRISELWKHHTVIGPGGACTYAAERFLRTGDWTTMGAPVGQAGNGTAMRTAALGLLYLRREKELVDEVAAISRLTHTDSRSVAGGVAIAEAARQLAIDPFREPVALCESVANAVQSINSELAGYIRELPVCCQSEAALEFIAWAGQRSPEFDRPIITPFVIPTVLAALYALIHCPNSWSLAVTFTIRLGGDVDTLGAIVGSLAGIRHGVDCIPSHLVGDVQNSEYLHSLAARYYVAIHRFAT